MLKPLKFLHIRLNLRALVILLQVYTVVVSHKFRGEAEILGGKLLPPNSSRISNATDFKNFIIELTS